MLGRGPWGLGTFISVHTGIGCVGIVRFGNEEQKKKYLPKMARGEWIGSFALTEPERRLRRRRDADAAPCARATSGCSTAPRPSSPTRPRRTTSWCSRAASNGISAFIVDRDSPGVRIGQVFETIGHKRQQAGRGGDGGLPHPEGRAGRRGGQGLRLRQALPGRGPHHARRRAASAPRRRRWSSRSSTAMQRKTFGQPLAEHQALAFRFAQMSARTEAARLCVLPLGVAARPGQARDPRVVDRQAGRRRVELADGRRVLPDLRRQRATSAAST